MKRNILNKLILILVNIIFGLSIVFGQERLEIRVFSALDSLPIPDCTIHIKGLPNTFKTNGSGFVSLSLDQDNIEITISHIGYHLQGLNIKLPTEGLQIYLNKDEESIEEIVVSTGYQKLPIGSITGSFAVIGNELYNRSVGTDILGRLGHVTSGLIFNKDKYAGENNISIRGVNTIFGDSKPLIVLDNYPFEGDINLINPNDVESVTVLKDASAASIWGAKAGNGVIVINTKKGMALIKPTVAFGSNIRIEEKPDLFYETRMELEDYLLTEKRLFDQGYYQSVEESYDNKPLSSYLELLIDYRDNRINDSELQLETEKLLTNNLRKDVSNHLYRQSLERQYYLNMRGGSQDFGYYLSGGLDENLENLRGNSFERYTLNLNLDQGFLGGRIKLSSRFNFSESSTINNGTELNLNSFAPYVGLTDKMGNPMAVTYEYRERFLNNFMNRGGLDWTYNPLTEIENRNIDTRGQYFRFNPTLDVTLVEGLIVQINYQFETNFSERRADYGSDSYFSRNLINSYTQFDTNGTISRPIPKGGIMEMLDRKSQGNSLRGQLSYRKTWTNKLSLDAISGLEQRVLRTDIFGERIYGYNREHARGEIVDLLGYYTLSNNPYSVSRIPSRLQNGKLNDNYKSYYASAVLSIQQKYGISGSARLDQSNLFGVKTNQKGVPLFSVGASWKLDSEPFYKFEFLPKFQLRTSFGYNGNVNKSVSAYVTAQYADAGQSPINEPFATIVNPPNPMLRWERIRVWNLGIDFGSKRNRINGTIDFFGKKGMDLIGQIPFAPSTGITNFIGNTANTRGNGFDLTINTTNLIGKLGWVSNILLSHINDKVTRYVPKTNSTNLITYGEGLIKTPIEGRPLYAIYSYRSAGLDGENGNPIGFLAGEKSQDYSEVISNTSIDDLYYHGSTRPTYYGAIRNEFTYKAFELSFNVSFSLGHFFRKPSIGYGETYGLGGNSDYYKRWKSPGDENLTYVPSMPTGYIAGRDFFYANSEVLVSKADNIRLQDIKMSWSPFPGNLSKGSSFRSLRLYIYLNNLGPIWKRNKFGIDPENVIIPQSKQFTFGFNMEL